jgi:phytoene dehydrogenase-like protein
VVRESVDIVVIGSGIGGLTAARMLAQFGHKRVLVLDQYHTLGSMTHEFTRDARFHFATGVRYLGTTDSPQDRSSVLDSRSRLASEAQVRVKVDCTYPCNSVLCKSTRGPRIKHVWS